MTFLELAQRRGTTRGFSPRPVDAPDLAYVLAARDRGLGSVLVGLFDPRILQREFHLPDHLEITALLFLGYPAGDFPSPHRHDAERKPLEETVRYETWDEEPAPA